MRIRIEQMVWCALGAGLMAAAGCGEEERATSAWGGVAHDEEATPVLVREDPSPTSPTSAASADLPEDSRLGRAMLRVGNTMGLRVCELYVDPTFGRCGPFLAHRDGPDGKAGTADDAPAQSVAELRQRLGDSGRYGLSAYVEEQGLLSSPCFGAAEEAAARAVFDLWRAGQPKSDGYLGVWAYQLNNVLQILPPANGTQTFVLAVGWEAASPSGTWFTRWILTLDGQGRELKRRTGRALRVYPYGPEGLAGQSGKLLVDVGIEGHDIGPGSTAEYYEPGDARVLLPDGRLSSRLGGSGHLSPGGVWRLGGGQQVLLSPYYPTTFDAAQGFLYALGQGPATCGTLMPVERGWPGDPLVPQGAADDRAVVRLANTFEANASSPWYLSFNSPQRNGADGLYNTADDALFSSVAQLRQVLYLLGELRPLHLLVNRCVAEPEEARALAAYRGWRKTRPVTAPSDEVTYQLLGPVAASGEAVLVAVERSARVLSRYSHSFQLLWLDDSGGELRRVPGRVLRLLPGGALIGDGYDWNDDASAEPKAASSIGRVDMGGVVWMRQAETRIASEMIWPYADQRAVLAVSWGEGAYMNEFKRTRPRAYSLATGQLVGQSQPQCGEDW